jgi:hypothetical protein
MLASTRAASGLHSFCASLQCYVRTSHICGKIFLGRSAGILACRVADILVGHSYLLPDRLRKSARLCLRPRRAKSFRLCNAFPNFAHSCENSSERSASFQPAVSQISNLQTFGMQRAVRNVSVDSSFGCGPAALSLCAFELISSVLHQPTARE